MSILLSAEIFCPGKANESFAQAPLLAEEVTHIDTG